MKQIMVFKAHTFRKCYVPDFYLGPHKLKECILYKYLGHFITDSRSDNIEIARQCRSIFAKRNTLIRTFHKCSDKLKVTLFRAYCTNLYTAELWCIYTQAALRKLAVTYHSIFKKMLNFPRNTSNSLLFVSYGIPTLQELIRKRIFSFKNCLIFSDNVLISDITSSDGFASSTISSRWDSLLF